MLVTTCQFYHDDVTLTSFFDKNSLMLPINLSRTNNMLLFQSSHGWCRRIEALSDEPVATSNMEVLADDCMSIHVHVLGLMFFLSYLIIND